MRAHRATLPKKVRKPPTALKDRLLRRICVDDSGCWLFLGYLDEFGYGKIGDEKGAPMPAHRASWNEHIGRVPAGMCVLHKCDVPNCINPDHLFLGTRFDNVKDMDAKGRRPLGEECSYAKLTDAQVEGIRARYRPRMGAILAREFGVSRTHVTKLIRGERRKPKPTTK